MTTDWIREKGWTFIAGYIWMYGVLTLVNFSEDDEHVLLTLSCSLRGKPMNFQLPIRHKHTKSDMQEVSAA